MTEQSACFAPKQPVDEEKAKLKSRAKESNVWELVSREKCPLLLCSERHDWQTPSWLFETGCVQLWARLQSANWCCAVTVITWAFGRFYTVLGELLCIISGYRCYGSFHLMKPADNGEWELTSFNKNPSLVRESGYQHTDQQSLSLQHSPGFKYLLQNKRQYTAGLHLWFSPKKEFTLPHTSYSGWSPWEAITLTLAMSTIMQNLSLVEPF